MLVRQIADSKLAQFAYLIGCPRSGEAVVIDPERDVDRYFEEASRHNLRIVAAVDTHIHADYLRVFGKWPSAASWSTPQKRVDRTGSTNG